MKKQHFIFYSVKAIKFFQLYFPESFFLLGVKQCWFPATQTEKLFQSDIERFLQSEYRLREGANGKSHSN